MTKVRFAEGPFASAGWDCGAGCDSPATGGGALATLGWTDVRPLSGHRMTAVLSAGIPVAPRVSCCCVDVTRGPDDVSPEPELEPAELFPISSIRWTISVKSGKDHLPARSALAGKSN